MTIRVLHTSDWHLGKKLFKLDRLPEQEQFLEWLKKTITTEKIDLLTICGDIFDVPSPPHQALKLFYHFLYELTETTHCEVLVIAGNHDSGILLEAPSPILLKRKIHIWGQIKREESQQWWSYKKGYEEVHFCALPFFRSYEFLPQGGDAVKLLEEVKTYLTPDPKLSGKKILLAHHLFGDYEAAGSEQVVSLSGLESLPLDLVRHFDEVLLGHIHKPQVIRKTSPRITYAGSPLPMRFSEQEEKRVRLLELDSEINERNLPVPCFRPLLRLKTDQKNWEKDLVQILKSKEGSYPAVLELELSLPEPLPGLIDEIKKELSHHQIELLSFYPIYPELSQTSIDLPKLSLMDPLELFETYYRYKFPEAKDISQELIDDYLTLVEKVKHANK